MADRTHVFFTNGEITLPDQIDKTFRKESGWLTVRMADGTFVDYPPHMIEKVERDFDQ